MYRQENERFVIALAAVDWQQAAVAAAVVAALAVKVTVITALGV